MRVVIDPSQDASERRADDPVERDAGQSEEDHDVEVERRRQVQVDSRQARPRDAGQPVGRPEPLGAEGRGVQHLGQRERQHDEVHAAHPDRQVADDEPRDPRGDGGQEHRRRE